MESYIFPLLLLLGLSIFISPKYILWQRKRIVFLKWGVTLVALVFYVVYFFSMSFGGKKMNTYGVEIVNKLPQSLDFYLIKVGHKEGISPKIVHSGKIRSEYYRLEQLDMSAYDEIWVVGFLGKDNMVYYSQHAVPNKNVDSVIEVNNYMITSRVLSSEAKKMIGYHIQDNYRRGAYVTLSLLFLLINLLTLPKKNLRNL